MFRSRGYSYGSAILNIGEGCAVTNFLTLHKHSIGHWHQEENLSAVTNIEKDDLSFT